MSIVRHGGKHTTALRYRESEETLRAQEGHAVQAQRQVVTRQQARRALARIALRNGNSSAELREVLDALGLTVSPAALKRFATMEGRVNAGQSYRRTNHGRPTQPIGSAR